MKLSVIIVSWESSGELSECLKAIFESKVGFEYEVVVIDNGSSDESPELVKKECPQVHLVQNSWNRGFARAANQGMLLSRGDYLLLLNPDVVLKPDSLEALAGYLDRHPDVGAVAPQMVFPDGAVQASCREFPSYQILLWELTGFSRLFPRHPVLGRWKMGYFDHASVREVDQPMASCFLLRREVLEKTGYLDEDFPLYFNDVDWCCRMKKNKVRIVFFPGARVTHGLGSSTAKHPYGKALLHRGMHDFLAKHDHGRVKFLWKPLFWVPLLLSSGPAGWRFFFQSPLQWEL